MAAGEPRARRSRRVLIGSVAALVAVVAVVVAGGVWVVSSLLPSDSHPVTDVPLAEGQSSSAPAAGEGAAPSVTDPACPTRDVGQVAWGRGNGDTSSAVQTIRGFNYAYYVTRSGAAARSYVAPNALFGSAPQLQQAIDSLPAGTTHCLQITDQGGGTYAVTVAEFRPGAPRPVINAEVLTTADVGGRTLITGIPKNETVQK